MSQDRFPCPCCGFLMFTEPPGSYEICQICRWEDDPLQLNNPHMRGGANSESLWDCQQEALREHPANEARRGHYRRAEGWRPLEPGDLKGFLVPCNDHSFTYYWEAGPRCAVTGSKPV